MKKIIKIMCVAVMAFILTGCYKVNIHMEVDNEGIVTQSIEVLVEEESMKQLETMGSDLDEMKKSIQGDQKGGMKDISKTIDDVKYKGFVFTSDEKADGVKEKIIKIKNDEMTFTFSKELIAELLESMNSSAPGVDPGQMDSYGMEFKLNVKMPGEVKSTNEGKKEDNKVSVDIYDLQDKDLVIKSEIDKDNNMIIIIVGVIAAIVVIAGGAFFFMQNKKKKANVASETVAETPEKSVEETAPEKDNEA